MLPVSELEGLAAIGFGSERRRSAAGKAGLLTKCCVGRGG